MGLGTLIRETGVRPEIVSGHDYRSYSQAIKMALASGGFRRGADPRGRSASAFMAG